MKNIEVTLYDPLDRGKADLYKIVPTCIIQPNFKLIGGTRKFIILVNQETLVIAIGPVSDMKRYQHKDILFYAEKDFVNTSISGGGHVTFSIEEGNPWCAEFFGQSGDFGVFDHEVFESDIAQTIANAMKMSVSFKSKIELSEFARFGE